MLLLGIMESVSPLTSPMQHSGRQFDIFIFNNNNKHICSNASYAICLGKYTNIIHSRFCNNEHSLFVCSGLKGYSFQESWLGQTQIHDRARFSDRVNQQQLKSVQLIQFVLVEYLYYLLFRKKKVEKESALLTNFIKDGLPINNTNPLSV